MESTVEALVIDLLDWVTSRNRTYEEFMDAWRTSCPRLPVWEDANDRGLIMQVIEGNQRMVRITPAGLAMLGDHRSRRT